MLWDQTLVTQRDAHARCQAGGRRGATMEAPSTFIASPVASMAEVPLGSINSWDPSFNIIHFLTFRANARSLPTGSAGRANATRCQSGLRASRASELGFKRVPFLSASIAGVPLPLESASSVWIQDQVTVLASLS